MDLSDQVLVEKIKAGDFQAFEALVNRYEGKVYRLSMRMLRNQQDAEDALQETFLQVYRGLKNFEGRSSFSTWLFRLATNVSLMKIRHRQTEPSKLLPLEDYLPQHEEGEHPQIQDWPDLPEETLLSKESREKMLEALEKLPAEYRAVFILRDIEGFTNAEAGETLGISVAAVKSRLHRARLTLRGMLAEYFEKKKQKGI
ncbi:MAG: sigma-70 family RNA polymerase sigma factor [Deltaproteobacteria bacterium]|nr:sigma-70 family RNA polymerase sigma factor [Deltaproteobacteria bacterium]